jgi:hypothetical protein
MKNKKHILGKKFLRGFFSTIFFTPYIYGLFFFSSLFSVLFYSVPSPPIRHSFHIYSNSIPPSKSFYCPSKFLQYTKFKKVLHSNPKNPHVSKRV